MEFYVIKNRATNKNVAVVVHDYVAKHYIVQSLSEAFRRAFEASIKSLGPVTYTAVNNKLLKSNLNLGNPSWAKEVLKKSCGSHWTYTKKNETMSPYSLQIHETIEKYLL